MVRRVVVSKKDQITLARLSQYRVISESTQPEDYKNRVVLKPWGYEYLIFENKYVAVWFLHIKKGHSTSMHCHRQKKTSLILLSGKALCNTFEHRNYLDCLDAIILDSGVFHSTKALSPKGIDVIEIETPPNKTDLVRLNDEYGRASSGYEGITEMQEDDLSKFNHFFFDEDTNHQKYELDGSYTISLDILANKEGLKIQGNAFYSLFKGQIVDEHNHVVLGVGETEKGDVLRGDKKLQYEDQIILLKTQIFE
jgi:mannose-6-phosphate isomerase-like protein (cupin superfamily)